MPVSSACLHNLRYPSQTHWPTRFISVLRPFGCIHHSFICFPSQEPILASPILDLDDARAYAAEHDDTYAQGYEYDNDEKSVTEDGGRERSSAEKEKDPYDVRVQPA